MFGQSSSNKQSSPTVLNLDPNYPLYSVANLPADCINLGLGYMNFAPPKWVTEAAEQALNAVGPNHYSHPRGRIRLREAIKAFYSPQFNRDLDVESEILITSGANEGIVWAIISSELAYLLNHYRAIRGLHRIFRTRRWSYHVRTIFRPVSSFRYLQWWQTHLRSTAPTQRLCRKPEKQRLDRRYSGTPVCHSM